MVFGVRAKQYGFTMLEEIFISLNLKCFCLFHSAYDGWFDDFHISASLYNGILMKKIVIN